jgi:hypothetical protein
MSKGKGIVSFVVVHGRIYINFNKGKAIPLQAWTSP